MTGGPLPPWATAKTGGTPAPDTPLDRQFSAFIGPRWQTYRRKFAPFFDDPRFQPTWNWSAALVTLFGPFWFLYRRLYVVAALFWMLPSLALGFLWNGDKVGLQDLIANTPAAQDFKLVIMGIQLSTMVLAGGTANFWLYRRARAAMRLAQLRGSGSEETLALLARVGRVNWIGVGILLLAMLLALFSMAGGRRA